MKANGISVEDIRNLVEGKLVVELPDYKATCSARQLVSYTKKAYPFADGVDVETSTDTETNTITLSVIRR